MIDTPDSTYDQGIYPEGVGHAVPEPMPIGDFQPWHLPRKQWCDMSNGGNARSVFFQSFR